MNEVAYSKPPANIQCGFFAFRVTQWISVRFEQGDIHFSSWLAFGGNQIKKRDLSLRLTDFVIRRRRAEEARRAVKHWSQWIDYWAADWDNKGDTFTTNGRRTALARTKLLN